MPSNQPSQELTFRDVLSQVDRRLSLLEEDLRSLRVNMDTRFEAIQVRFQLQDDRWDRKFRWLIGLIFASWLSMMTAVLLK